MLACMSHRHAETTTVVWSMACLQGQLNYRIEVKCIQLAALQIPGHDPAEVVEYLCGSSPALIFDHDIADVHNQMQAWQDERMYGPPWQFCRQNFLSNQTMEAINQIRLQLGELVVSAGFLGAGLNPSSMSKGALDALIARRSPHSGMPPCHLLTASQPSLSSSQTPKP